MLFVSQLAVTVFGWGRRTKRWWWLNRKKFVSLKVEENLSVFDYSLGKHFLKQSNGFAFPFQVAIAHGLDKGDVAKDIIVGLFLAFI